MKIPRNSDICVSIRSVAETGSKSLDNALALIREVRPDRNEWSYVWGNGEAAAAIRKEVPVFVAAINTISPRGHAVDIEGAPIIAPWMQKFGSPGNRCPYMCANNPEDVAVRHAQIEEAAEAGLADAVQHDDWFGNGAMIRWNKACFCEHCVAGFSEYLGLDIDYKAYLLARGIYVNQELFERVWEKQVPLWDDYVRFQERMTIRYLKGLRATVIRVSGGEPAFAVNGNAFDPKAREMLPGVVDYLNGEFYDFKPKVLWELAGLAREMGVKQIVTLVPRTPEETYHTEELIMKVRRAHAVAYAVGLIPQFPYDVYNGEHPRWFGTWEEYGSEYDKVRENHEVFDDYEPAKFREKRGVVEVTAQHREQKRKTVTHRIHEDATWEIER